MTDIQTTELSERETEILKLVATGASNKEIAQQLYISANTVKVHLRNIFAKIGAASRTEAAMYAVNAGLVPGGAPVVDEEAARPQEAVIEPEIVTQPAVDLNPPRWGTLSRIYWALAVLLLVVVVFGGFRLAEAMRQPAPTQPAATLPEPTDSARWQSLAAMPTARFGLALAAYENQIYALAGEAETGITGVVERFDLDSGEWVTLIPKPLPVTDVEAVVIGGRVFLPGGRLASGQVTDVMEIYDPREDAWSQGAPLPVALSAYSLAAFEGKLYLFGGWDGSRYVDSVYEYDPEQNSWNSKTPMSLARGYSGAVVTAGRIYVLGGYDGVEALTMNAAYLPDRDAGGDPWSEVAPLPEARYGMGVAGVADIVYLVGGHGGAEGVEFPSLAYFPQTGEWRSFDAPTLNVGADLGLVSLGPSLFALGGRSDTALFDHNLAYQAMYSISIPVIVK